MCFPHFSLRLYSMFGVLLKCVCVRARALLLKFLAPIPSVGVRHLGEWFSVAVIAIMGLFLFLHSPLRLLRLLLLLGARPSLLSDIVLVCMRVRCALILFLHFFQNRCRRRRLKVCGGRSGTPRKKPPNDDDVAGKKCTTLAVVTVLFYTHSDIHRWMCVCVCIGSCVCIASLSCSLYSRCIVWSNS